MNIELYVERLIFDGLSVEPRHRAQVQSAVEAELTHLRATGGLRSELLSGGTMRSLSAGQMTASRLGSHIAEAVHFGIGGAPGSTNAKLI